MKFHLSLVPGRSVRISGHKPTSSLDTGFCLCANAKEPSEAQKAPQKLFKGTSPESLRGSTQESSRGTFQGSHQATTPESLRVIPQSILEADFDATLDDILSSSPGESRAADLQLEKTDSSDEPLSLKKTKMKTRKDKQDGKDKKTKRKAK